MASEFKNLQEQLEKLPVDMTYELERIQDTLDFHDRLSTEARRVQKNDFKTLKKIISSYKKCPIFIAELNKIEK